MSCRFVAPEYGLFGMHISTKYIYIYQRQIHGHIYTEPCWPISCLNATYVLSMCIFICFCFVYLYCLPSICLKFVDTLKHIYHIVMCQVWRICLSTIENLCFNLSDCHVSCWRRTAAVPSWVPFPYLQTCLRCVCTRPADHRALHQKPTEDIQPESYLSRLIDDSYRLIGFAQYSSIQFE